MLRARPVPGYHFNLTDWLGTKRMQTTSGGNQQETCMSYPFGDGLICTGGTDATEQHFTGKDRDVAAGPWRQERPEEWSAARNVPASTR